MEKKYDIVIIGAGPAGISAAIYASRAKLKTLVIDSGESGGQIRITNEVVNYPGILSISGAELSDTMRKQATEFGAEIIHANINEMELAGDWKVLKTDKDTYKALGVIIATGAKPRKIGFKGETEYQGRGVGYCATCDGEFFTGLEVLVVGGGFAAAEEAMFLTRYASKVTVLVRGSEFTCSKSIADKVLADPKIEVKFNHELKEVSGDNVLKKAVIYNNKTDETYEFVTEDNKTFGVFVFAGYEPLSGFVKNVVTLDERGYILTDDDMKTNIDGVYAAGDIRPKKLRQLVTAVSDGAIASTNAEKYIHDKKEALGIVIESEAPKQASQEHRSESLLDSDLKTQLAPILERFENNICLAVIKTGDVKAEGELLALANDFASMSDKISVKELSFAEGESVLKTEITGEYPVLAILDKEFNYAGVCYGAIGGHEFNSFVLALYNAAGPGQNIPEDSIEKIKAIDKKLDIKVGVTLSCTMCPDVVQACQIAALNNPNITMQVIDVSRNSGFRSGYNIMSVPAMVIDGQVSFGRKNLDEVIAYLSSL